MAPDLNSVPPSPHPLGSSSPRISSRRTSQQMGPPQIPLSSPALNILPSNQITMNGAPPPITSPPLTGNTALAVTNLGDNAGVGTGPGPLRHPRPLTAADLHLQMEKEQEMAVNRLTRELSMLRAAQNASVVSNSSSTSAGFPDPADANANHLLSGPSHPLPSTRRHHRSSSSTSTRSNTAITTISTSTAGWTTGGVAGSVSSAVPDRARAGYGRHDSNPQNPQSISLSRQNSITSSRRSGASSPALLSSNPSSYQHADYFLTGYTQRPSMSMHRDPSATRGAIPESGERVLSSVSITSVPTTGRYEEAAFHRHELESVKRENEALRRRIRELERTIRERRQSDASRTRSESVSTSASFNNRDSVGAGRGRELDEKDESEEVVRVGESARSGRLR